MNTPTIDEFKAWAKEHQSLALAVCKAQAFAQCERKRVSTYIRPIFDRYTFQATLSGDNGRITDPERLYLCEDEKLTTAFYADCDKAHRLYGFTGPDGCCPALIAEDKQRKAEAALLEAGAVLMGIEDIGLYGENRAKML